MLTRHYQELSDEALRAALADGEAAYTPVAWAVLTGEAAARGVRAPLLPPGGSPMPPLAGRVAAAAVLAGMGVLALNAFRGWHWFGGADRGVLLSFSLVSVLVLRRWFMDDWLERVRHYDEARRTGAPAQSPE